MRRSLNDWQRLDNIAAMKHRNNREPFATLHPSSLARESNPWFLAATAMFLLSKYLSLWETVSPRIFIFFVEPHSFS